MKTSVFILFFLAFTNLFGQTGPAGVGNTDGTSDLKLWLDASRGLFKDSLGRQSVADSARLRRWSDLSGNNHHVFARTDSTLPRFIANNPLLNFQNSVRFSRRESATNTRNYLSSDAFSVTEDMTVYCVFHALTKGGGYNASLLQSDKRSDSLWYGGAGLVDADVVDPKNDISMTLCDTSLSVGGGDSVSKMEYTVKTPVSLNKTYFGLLEKKMSSGTMSVSQNGEKPTSLVASTQPINSSAKYTIGATSNLIYGKDENFFDGYISEVIVLNKLASEAEGIILANYLSAKYSIPLKNNDLYKMDEAVSGSYQHDFAAIGLGNDEKVQTSARGSGMIEIRNPAELNNGEYLLWAHNGQSLAFQPQDVPEGAKQRLTRTWRANEIGETGKLDIIVDVRNFSNTEVQDLVVLVDLDNNGSFENELFGQGMLPQSKYLGNGQYLFSKVNINNENRFTFGTLKPACQTDCDAVFTPNNDGVGDTYFLDNVGKTVVMDKAGHIVRELIAPTFWDGTKSNGTPAKEGLYFLVSNDTHQRTVTLLK